MQRRQKPIGIFQAILCSIVLAVILGMSGVPSEWAGWVSLGICFLGYIGMRLPQTHASASASPITSATAVRGARFPPVPEINSRYTSDHTGEAEFPFPKQVVFRALCEAVGGRGGMEVVNRDELACRLNIKIGMSAFSWGEKVSVLVSENGDQTAIISVQSFANTISGPSTTHNKNRKNIREIITRTSKLLQEHGARWREEIGPAMTDDTTDEFPSVAEIIAAEFAKRPQLQDRVPIPEGAAAPLIADELAKLAQLRDQGILSEREFQSQKARLLR